MNAKLRNIAKGVLVCLRYPRGSEAQIRCLEEVGQDVPSALESEASESAALRTRLAGKAMAGLLANSRYMKCMSKAKQSKVATDIAAIAVQNADAILAKLNKEQP